MTDIQHRSTLHLGIALILATAFTISVQDVVFKLFSSKLTLWQIFALRGLMAVPVLVAITFVRRQGASALRSAFRLWPLLRATFITTTFVLFYAAIPFLSLSTVGAANYTAPIFVAVLSAFVIGEPIRRLGWLGVGLGFVGVLVLLQPGKDAFSVFALLPVIGAGFYAVGHIITRTRCRDVPAAALSLAQNTMMLVAGLGISAVLVVVGPSGELAQQYPYILGEWSNVSATDWMILALLAGFAVALGMMLSAAYQLGPPATIATFEYSYLVFVAAWDILFFGIAPTAYSLIGMGMIVVAGILVMQRRG